MSNIFRCECMKPDTEVVQPQCWWMLAKQQHSYNVAAIPCIALDCVNSYICVYNRFSPVCLELDPRQQRSGIAKACVAWSRSPLTPAST